MLNKAVSKIKNIFFKYKIFFYIFFSLLILFTTSFIFIKKTSPQKSENYKINIEDRASVKTCGDNCAFRLLDGLEVLPEKVQPFLISTVIDNHNEARPQFSLAKATLVYDIPAEGGINRYLAFFLSDATDVAEIGPIRSARPYFIDISSEYNSLLVHCGGSPEALARIIKEKKLALNEFYNGYYFRRYANFSAPHNVLANFSRLQEYLKKESLVSSEFESWKFKDAKINTMLVGSSSESIKMSNGFKDYGVEWVYNEEKNNYSRKLAGVKQVDDSGETVSAVNIIFQIVKTEILDKELRLKIQLTGEGSATVCLDGSCQKAYWKKSSTTSRTTFYYLNDEEIEFNRGKTWIQLVDNNYSVTF